MPKERVNLPRSKMSPYKDLRAGNGALEQLAVSPAPCEAWLPQRTEGNNPWLCPSWGPPMLNQDYRPNFPPYLMPQYNFHNPAQPFHSPTTAAPPIYPFIPFPFVYVPIVLPVYDLGPTTPPNQNQEAIDVTIQTITNSCNA